MHGSGEQELEPRIFTEPVPWAGGSTGTGSARNHVERVW